MPTVLARCHPKPVDDPQSKTWWLRRDETKRVLEAFRYKPVYVGHDKSRAVGHVRDFSWGPNDEILCELWINSSDYGKQVMQQIREQKLRDISIGMVAPEDVKTEARVGEYTPHEISLCEEGSIPHSNILCVEIDQHYIARGGPTNK